MPAAASWSPLRADMLMGVFWMVELYFSAVTVISSRPVSSEVASEAAARSTQHTETARLASQSRMAARGRRTETANRSAPLVPADLMDLI